MADVYIHEFLFRGKRDGATEIHVYLAACPMDPFTNEPGEPVLKGPLPVEAAAQLGYPLPVILDLINKQTVAELDTTRALAADLQKRVEDLTSQGAELQAQVAALQSQANTPQG